MKISNNKVIFPTDIEKFIDELFFVVEERAKVGEYKEIKFVVYAGDHNPPHIHCKYDKYEIKISLDDFSVIYMSHKFPSKRLKFAKSWVKENKEKLMKEWTKYNVDGIGVLEESYLDKEIKRQR